MNFTVDYFRDEVRCGFYIPTAVKQAWAANLMVLGEIDRICEKHGIRYFADWGSILGAVRHGGYVPWDDDLDICMLRDDYIRFREVAPTELPERFEIQDYASKEDHWLMLSRVVSEHSISFDEEHLAKYHNFPYISVVDIFIQDYLYKDPELERERCREVKELLAVADGTVEGSISPEVVELKTKEYEKRYGVHLPRLNNYKRQDSPILKANGKPDCSDEVRSFAIELYKLAEKQMSRVPADEAESVGQIFPWILKGGQGKPKRFYEKSVRLPFENTTIPVPACYHEILAGKYGDYLVARKVWSGHNYPYFEGQKKNLQSVADFDLPEFKFSEEMIAERISPPEEETFKGIVGAYLTSIREYSNQALTHFESFDFGEVLALLPELQQMAVDLGNYIEKVKGEYMPSAVSTVEVLQEYCDAVYGLYTDINGMLDEEQLRDPISFMAADRLKVALEKLDSRIGEELLKRRSVVFFPVGAKQWKGFEQAFARESKRDDTDIYIVPLPVLFKDIYGRVTASEDEIRAAAGREDYPVGLVTHPWENFDVRTLRPDTIYIQDPYDGENPCLTVPSGYYALKLKDCTDELIFIPAFETGEFTKEDINDIYNMKHYAAAPGVICADRVLLQSENIRQLYIDRLTEFAGEKTHALWESKLETAEWLYAKGDEDAPVKGKQEKKLLYVIGLNELSEHKQDIAERVKDRLELFREHSEGIEVTVRLFPKDKSLWDKVDRELTNEIDSLIEACGLEEKHDSLTKEEETDIYDAYYGSASPYVPLFVERKKPVMIADYSIG